MNVEREMAGEGLAKWEAPAITEYDAKNEIQGTFSSNPVENRLQS